MITTEDRAAVAYRAYGDYTEWKNFAGMPMPQWDELPETIRGAWIAAIAAALTVQHPPIA